MYARLLAFVCLLSCSVSIGRAEPTSVAGATVGVYLQVDPTASNLSIQSLRQEMQDLLAPTGMNLVWTKRGDSGVLDKLVVMELRGTCQPATEKAAKFKDHTALASTAVTDGNVLPFSWADCQALNSFLGKSLAQHPKQEREELYGRALARLLAHELYHVMTQSEAHTESGISKAAFSVTDLLAQQFTFQKDALALLTREPAPVLTAEFAASDDSYGEFGLALEAFADDGEGRR